MEIAPGIYRIASTVGERPMYLYLLRGDYRTVLVDSGCSWHVEEAIFPFLTGLGLGPDAIDMIVVTHSDADHIGGNGLIKAANPRVLVTCGTADRARVESLEKLWSTRYDMYQDEHGLGVDDATRAVVDRMVAPLPPVDFTWSGGEELRLGPDWVVQIHHVPGHTQGHLLILDPRSRTALMGDTVHGAVYPDVQGRPAMPPTYEHVDSYLSTIRYLRSLGIVTLCGCHWPAMRGPEVTAFLDQSQQFVEHTDRVLLAELAQRRDGATARELRDAVGARLGGWPRSEDANLDAVIVGHLERLALNGAVKRDSRARPVRYAPN